MKTFPDGCIVTLITPFTDGGKKIDYDAVDALVEWQLASGSVGIFTPCLSSEMFALSAAERLELASHVKQLVGGRGVVVATGTYGGTIEEQAEFVRSIAACCDAVVVNTATLVDKGANDAAWQQAAEQLLKLTGDVPLGLYECPVPYKRLLSPQLIGWCASTGRFHFHKDTSCNMVDIQAKLAAVQPPFRFYNANIETLLPSLRAGGAGFSGISANFYPHLHAWMCQAVAGAAAAGADRGAAKRQKSAVPLDVAIRKVHDFLTLAEGTVVIRYPASAKAYLTLPHTPELTTSTNGDERRAAELLLTTCRHRPDGTPADNSPFLEHQRAALQSMWRVQRDLCEELGIEMPPLPTK